MTSRRTKDNAALNVLSIFTSVITFYLTISVLYFLYCTKKNLIKSKIQKTLIILCTVFYAIAMTVMAVLFNAIDGQNVFGFLVFSTFHNWAIGCTYFLFISRFYDTFSNSAYQSAQWIFISLYTCIIIFLVLHILVIIFTLLDFYSIISSQTKYHIFSVQLTLKAMSIIYCSLVMTYSFVSKLVKVTYQAQINNEGDTFVGSKFLNTATKITVLAILMMISSVALMIIGLISTFSAETSFGEVLWKFGRMFGIMMDSLINIFCIYMTLPFKPSKKLYGICCKPTCHRCCLHLMKQRLKRDIDKIKMISMDQIQSQTIQSLE